MDVLHSGNLRFFVVQPILGLPNLVMVTNCHGLSPGVERDQPLNIVIYIHWVLEIM